MRKNLKKFRIDLGLKTKEIAEKLGISPSYYSLIENGRKDPTYGFMEKFGETFNYDDMWELFKKCN